ncbi:molybdenum ABC transporter [Campylobacter sp. MIT 99-7217]|uniref:molybdenum ABC transporter n=1 Tax=Campylobacter sp. MIT 99-7217 TaxID=535091 RepID=UPI001157058B|nr:molybdenum ABC transporter [Campylobacter sp. MIT 99-7217]TQR32368.1 molybdenum ABC transporter [Campylobacter sp. MIT 99-7217]
MIHFSQNELESFILDDAPFGDLSTHLLDDRAKAKCVIYTREDIILSCLDMVNNLARIYNLGFQSAFENKDFIKAGSEILSLDGDFKTLHLIYKSVQNLLEHACGIATKAFLMKKEAQSVNENCQILVTRKIFPFSKKLCLKAALEGGAKVHRLGLSDSVLFFKTHFLAFENENSFLQNIAKFKAELCERKIIVEAENLSFAKELLKYGVNGVQCDKMKVEELENLVDFKKANFKEAVILAAGGINEKNAKAYAKTGIDAIVTSSVYKGVADLGASFCL